MSDMTGNPHYDKAAPCSTPEEGLMDDDELTYSQIHATLTLAYEQRTANLLQDQLIAQLGEIARILAPSGYPHDPAMPDNEQIKQRLGINDD